MACHDGTPYPSELRFTRLIPLADAFQIEVQNAARVMQSQDAKEGPRAFAEKREPVWKGR